MESNRAAPWNSRPNFLVIRISSSSSRRVISTSSMYISPESGLRRPIRCLMRTLLPEPLWPMTTIVSPFSMVRLTPRKTSFGPKDLWRSMMRIMSAAFERGRQQLADEKIEDQDRDAGDDDRARRRPADPLCAALGLHALPAADDGEDAAEDARFEEPGGDIPDLQVHPGVLDVHHSVDPHQDDIVEIPAEDTDDVPVED